MNEECPVYKFIVYGRPDARQQYPDNQTLGWNSCDRKLEKEMLTTGGAIGGGGVDRGNKEQSLQGDGSRYWKPLPSDLSRLREFTRINKDSVPPIKVAFTLVKQVSG